MNPSRASRIALELLDRLPAGAERDSLVGDIAEQAARGRSAAWGCTQALIAIASDTARTVRRHAVACLTIAFFAGYGAAVVLGTLRTLGAVKILPWPGLDQVMVGVGAGWIVGRMGRAPAVATCAALVLAMRAPIVRQPVMGLLDHFGGLWLFAPYGLASLPPSIIVANASIAIGGLGAVLKSPARASQADA